MQLYTVKTFLTTVRYTYLSVHYCSCVNVYSNWLRAQFYNLSLNMLYILSLQ